jgi:hypothetical protein
MTPWTATLTAELRRKYLLAIGKMRSRTFNRSEFGRALTFAAQKAELDIDEILGALFECSFIGTKSESDAGETYYRFRHRNPAVSVSHQDEFEFHPGLWKAYNLA